MLQVYYAQILFISVLNYIAVPLHFLMILSGLRQLTSVNHRHSLRRIVSGWVLTLIATLSCLLLLGTPSALAGINDDNFDGNIYALYGGNGSLVPAKDTIVSALQRNKPALLVFFLDDSRDSKQFATVVSTLQAYYGRAASFIPVNVDAIPIKSSYTPQEPGYYYQGVVPQTVLLDQKGKVVLNEKGTVPFEKIDDVFRTVFDLVPNTESKQFKQKAFNEFNTELAR